MIKSNSRYTSWKIKEKPEKARCDAETRMKTGRRFHRMFSSLGWSTADVAKFLQVSVRTVQLWCAGKVRVPYAAYKLLRLQLRYELPGDAWNGWTISAGRLYTPEGHELAPRDFEWWSLLARRAAMFSVLYERQTRPAPEGTRVRGVAGAVASAYAGPWPQSSSPAVSVRARSAPHGNHGEDNYKSGAILGPFWYRMPQSWPSTFVYHQPSTFSPGSIARGSASALTRSSASLLTLICDSPAHPVQPPRHPFQAQQQGQALPSFHHPLHPLPLVPDRPDWLMLRQRSETKPSGGSTSPSCVKRSGRVKLPPHPLLTQSPFSLQNPQRPTGESSLSGTGATPRRGRK